MAWPLKIDLLGPFSRSFAYSFSRVDASSTLLIHTRARAFCGMAFTAGVDGRDCWGDMWRRMCGAFALGRVLGVFLTSKIALGFSDWTSVVAFCRGGENRMPNLR